MLSIFKKKRELHTPSHSEHPASGSQDRLLYREPNRQDKRTKQSP